MPEPSDFERDLRQLEAELRRLEAEYNMFFAGRLPRPPWETRARVEQLVKRLDRSPVTNYGDRFRFTTLQARYAAFADLWDRGLRAREEGRPGPFGGGRKKPPAEEQGSDRILHVTAFRDPGRERDKLRELYERVVEARRETGAEAVPFERFEQLVKSQVQQLRGAGSSEVAFRVSVSEGKLRFTVKGMGKGKP